VGLIGLGALEMSHFDRRGFLQSTGALATAGLAASPLAASPLAASLNQAKPLRFRLGIVTYNIAANWDLQTILKVCGNIGLSPVELRTTHKHGVEPGLTKEKRQEVKQRFKDSGIECWGCGTVCEFHSPEPAVVKKNIEICKEFCQL